MSHSRRHGHVVIIENDGCHTQPSCDPHINLGGMTHTTMYSNHHKKKHHDDLKHEIKHAIKHGCCTIV